MFKKKAPSSPPTSPTEKDPSSSSSPPPMGTDQRHDESVEAIVDSITRKEEEDILQPAAEQTTDDMGDVMVAPLVSGNSIAKATVIHYSPNGTVSRANKTAKRPSLPMVPRRSNIELHDEIPIAPIPISRYEESPPTSRREISRVDMNSGQQHPQMVQHVTKTQIRLEVKPPPLASPVTPIVAFNGPTSPITNGAKSRNEATPTPPRTPKAVHKSPSIEDRFKEHERKYLEWQQYRALEHGSPREQRLHSELLKEHNTLRRDVHRTELTSEATPRVLHVKTDQMKANWKTNNSPYSSPSMSSSSRVQSPAMMSKKQSKSSSSTSSPMISPRSFDENRNEVAKKKPTTEGFSRFNQDVYECQQREATLKKEKQTRISSNYRIIPSNNLPPRVEQKSTVPVYAALAPKHTKPPAPKFVVIGSNAPKTSTKTYAAPVTSTKTYAAPTPVIPKHRVEIYARGINASLQEKRKAPEPIVVPIKLVPAQKGAPKAPPKEVQIGELLPPTFVPKLKKVGMPVEKSGISLGKVLDTPSSSSPAPSMAPAPPVAPPPPPMVFEMTEQKRFAPPTAPPPPPPPPPPAMMNIPPPPPPPITTMVNSKSAPQPKPAQTDSRDDLMKEIREAGRLRAMRIASST